jgi:hypothetical protein
MTHQAPGQFDAFTTFTTSSTVEPTTNHDPPTDQARVIIQRGATQVVIPWGLSMKEWSDSSLSDQLNVETLQTRYLMQIQCGTTICSARLTLHRHTVTHETIYYIIPEDEGECPMDQQPEQPRVIIQRGKTRLVMTWDLSVLVRDASLFLDQIPDAVPVKLHQSRYRMKLLWDQTQLEILRFYSVL